MNQKLIQLAERISQPDTSIDLEEKGFDIERVIEILTRSFRGEVDRIRLHKDNGSHKWICLGDFHNQPIAIAVGKYSSRDHYRSECRLLHGLQRAVPQFFPWVIGYHVIDPYKEELVRERAPQVTMCVMFMEALDHMDNAFDFKEKRRRNKTLKHDLQFLAGQEGYAAGFVLGKTGLVLTDPNLANTLFLKRSFRELTIRFVDAERVKYVGDQGTSLRKLIREYMNEDCLRTAIINNRTIFTNGLEQGLEDSGLRI